jgi:hypothetical protein
VGILDSFERGLERAVNGAFARTFRSGLQPVEITAALKRELDTHAHPVARDRILVPNRFTVRMSEGDHIAMTALGDSLNDELVSQITQYAQEQGYSMVAPPEIALTADESLAIGMLEVESATERSEVSWRPVLEINGRAYPLTGRVVLGRGSDADITIDDTGISRKHLEISWDGRRAEARDLGSTNGSTLNGERFSRAVVPNESVLQIGRTRIVFRLQPQAARGRQ